MKGSDAFERSLRASLEGYEVPYNSADWAQMEQALDGQRPHSWWASPILYAAVLAGAVATTGALFLLSSEDGGSGQVQTTAQIPDLTMPNTGGSADQHTVANEAGGIFDSSAEKGTEQGLAENGTSKTLQGTNANGAGDEAGQRPATTTKEQAGIQTSGGSSSGAKTNGTERNTTLAAAGTVPAASKGAFTASLSRGCTGAAVEFNVNNMPEDGIYLWNFGDGTFSNKPNPNHTYNKPGRFTVTLSLSRSGAGTITNQPYADLIVIDEVPEAGFDHVYREYSGHVPSVHFENRSHGGTTYRWDFGDGTTSEVAHPDHVYRSKGTYKVSLTVRNSAGCEDVVERDVRIDTDYNLLAPASFSPNSDGDDDLFMPQALKDLGVKFQLSIYEPATGRMVYQTTDATKPWTGRMMNSGALCAPGEYVWMVEIKEGLHLGDITYEGKVSLVN